MNIWGGGASNAWEWEQQVQRPSNASMPGISVGQQESSVTKVQGGTKEEGQIKRSCRFILSKMAGHLKVRSRGAM